MIALMRLGAACAIAALLSSCNEIREDKEKVKLSLSSSTLAMGDNAAQVVNFQVSGGVVDSTQVITSAVSSDTSVIPDANLVLGGSGTDRTLTITPNALPSPYTPATVRITIGATNGTESVTAGLTVQVTHTGRTPTFASTITDQTIYSGSTTGDITFYLDDDDTAARYLTVTATSTVPGTTTESPVIPNNRIFFDTPADSTHAAGATRTIRLTPIAGQLGSARISMTVSDGEHTSAPMIFTATVTARPASKLVFTVQPPGAALSNSALSPAPVVAVQDEQGHILPNSAVTVTLTAHTDSACSASATAGTGDALAGDSTTLAGTNDGLATFSNFSYTLNEVRSGQPVVEKSIYLKASAGALTPTCSNQIALRKGTSGWWGWFNGSQNVNAHGAYAPTGLTSPGARVKPTFFSSGNFLYLLGGLGYDSAGAYGLLGDLWRTGVTVAGGSPATANWEVVSGSATTASVCSGAAAGAVASNRQDPILMQNGNTVYFFGGYGHHCGANGNRLLADVWRISIAGDGSVAWALSNDAYGAGSAGDYPGATDVNLAPTIHPGARYGGSGWYAHGFYWLFGGRGCAAAACDTSSAGLLGDLWKFDGAQWAWAKGLNTLNAVADFDNTDGSVRPGARMNATSWVDSSGQMWLFGGRGYNHESGTAGYLNDLWVFNPHPTDTINGVAPYAWALKSPAATQQRDRAGSYGVRGTPSSSNMPGARESAFGWVSGANLYLFGGYGKGLSNDGELNDLWKYNISSGQWTWISGGSGANAAGAYPASVRNQSSTNMPGARADGAAWVDGSGYLWMHGGYGWDRSNTRGYLNDLWVFQP